LLAHLQRCNCRFVPAAVIEAVDEQGPAMHHRYQEIKNNALGKLMA
jgi:hypothetical protein